MPYLEKAIPLGNLYNMFHGVMAAVGSLFLSAILILFLKWRTARWWLAALAALLLLTEVYYLNLHVYYNVRSYIASDHQFHCDDSNTRR